MLRLLKRTVCVREEERIDDGFDFEVAKSTKTLRSSCPRPVAETSEAKGSRLHNLFSSVWRVELPAPLPCIRIAMTPLRYRSSSLNGRWKSETPLQMMKEGRERGREKAPHTPIVPPITTQRFRKFSQPMTNSFGQPCIYKFLAYI